MRLFFNRWLAVSAADVVGGVFIAQRDLLKSLRLHVLAGSGLTPEIAEILIELFLAGGHLSSFEHADADGYLAFRNLQGALGYSPGLLSRRIGWLCQRRWAETKRAVPNVAEGIHGNCQKVRITPLGRDIIGPVWRRFDGVAERLLAGISPSDLAAHYRINEIISDKLRGRRFWMDEEGQHSVARPATVTAREAKPSGEARETALREKSDPVEPEREFLD